MTESATYIQQEDPDASIQRRLCQGDTTAFEDLMACYGAMVQRLACRLLGWEADVDDVVQDVFAAAYTHHKKFRAGSSLKTWLFSITVNMCRTRNRRRLLWQRFVRGRSVSCSRGVRCPASETLTVEQHEKVHGAVRRLPGRYRDVIVLKYLEELQTGQILEILKLSEPAFYTRLNRARNLLEKELSEYMRHEDE